MVRGTGVKGRHSKSRGGEERSDADEKEAEGHRNMVRQTAA